MNKRRIVALMLALALTLSISICFTLVACNKTSPTDKIVRISTTTSVNDSGLMAYLQPYFQADTDYKWEVSSAGTGAAINSAKYGNADVILVHSKASENAFISDGYARKVDGYTQERISFMYNYFVLIGPSGVGDVANVSGTSNVLEAFENISSTTGAKFISRGDKSGTHNAEIKLWPSSITGLWPDGNITNDVSQIPASILYNEGTNPTGFYVSAGAGMGACLTMANQMNAYCLTDKATFLSMKNASDGDSLPNLSVLLEESEEMKNTYSMLAVKADAPFVSSLDGAALPAGTVNIDTVAADVFINWMNSVRARYLIQNYGEEQYGEALFFLQALALSLTQTDPS